MPDYPEFGFEITCRDAETKARCGRLRTPHGTIETPAFVFCATKGALKGATTAQAAAAGAEIILANTYHLMLQPGADLVRRMGGLHRMMDWPKPVMTDSGGFQIFSLGHGGVADEIKGSRDVPAVKSLLKIEEDGAVFRSYLDGAIHKLTPELSIQVQRQLGADLILVLDECTPFHAGRDETARSMERTHRWEERSLAEFGRGDDGRQALYGIVQGGVFEDLREESAAFVNARPFFGQAVGGSLGSDKDQMRRVVGFSRRHLREDRPAHLLGIGGLSDLWEGAAQGMDTFDCVHPTRLARHGGALVHPAEGDGKEFINLKNARFREDFAPVEESCPCYACRKFSRACLHHLFKAGETLGGTLLTIHNIAFMARLAASIRAAIRENRFSEVKRGWLV